MDCQGYTLFPDDGGKILIVINGDIPFWATVEILSHELAHAALGENETHSKEWESLFVAAGDHFVKVMEGEKI